MFLDTNVAILAEYEYWNTFDARNYKFKIPFFSLPNFNNNFDSRVMVGF
mgnify:CR=1 FL=1|jgi:hypothetical protein